VFLILLRFKGSYWRFLLGALLSGLPVLIYEQQLFISEHTNDLIWTLHHVNWWR